MDTGEKDIYKTLAKATEMVLFKERKSKFYGYAYPLQSEAEVKPLLEKLQKIHPSANHFCYAWQLGVRQVAYRTNDDGEPNNSAGAPIYGQILSFGLTHVLVVVARVFGGTKLGVGGLMAAYKECARLTLEQAPTTTKTLKHYLSIEYEYGQMSGIMRFIKQNKLQVVEQEMAQECRLVVAVREQHSAALLDQLKGMHNIKVSLQD
jgi:uncharacterized YigZ family protein